MANNESWKNERFLIPILIVLCLILFFFQLGTRPIWDIDEGKHATTSKEMVLSSDWITPTFNGEPFYDKPILYNWLAALAFLAFGFTEFAARLPSAVLGSGCVMVTYLLGRKISGPILGFLSGTILATSFEFIVLSRAVVHDICLAFFITLALYLFYLGYRDEKHRKRNLLLFYAALGFAVLAKGPVGLAIPAMTIGLFLLYEKKMGFIREMQIGWGILIFLGIASPWYVLISLKNPEYAAYFFIKQNLGNFLSAETRHPGPFYYYIPVLFGGFFPWSCFLPLAVIYAFRRRFTTVHNGVLFIIIWFSIVFIFFSAATSKLATYILPLFPAASILVAILWHELLKKPSGEIRKGFMLSFLPVVILSLAAMIYLWFYPLVQIEYESGITPAQMNFLAIWTVVCIVSTFLFFVIKRDLLFFSAIGVTVVSTLIIFLQIIVPSVNPYRSSREFARLYDQLIPPDEKLVFYRRIKESALFYTNRKAIVLKTPDAISEYLDSPQRVFCIVTRKRLANLESMPYVVEQQGDKLLISNRKTF
ncbi:MAG: glycosyltransferase family 39 protein [Desulfobacterales bacterium]|jgi:4-amino-4-deoxy-L-arabinose transferase-like glycosyltransferase